MPSQRVGFLDLFGLKTGTHFAQFGMESGMVFEGTTGVYESFIVSIPNENERKIIMRIRDGFNFFCCLRFNLSNDDIIFT